MKLETLRFPILDQLGNCRALFAGRAPGVDVATDRETALARLQTCHDAILAEGNFAPLATAEQVHGDKVATAIPNSQAAESDALITNDPGVCLGIYVADCAAIYVIDRKGRAVGLAHSGKKGTALGILAKTAAALEDSYGVPSSDLVVAISPCIRPPDYEIDFAADIARQARELEVAAYEDCGINTAAEPDRWYSYRREKGRTGRMLALLQMLPGSEP